MFLGCTGHKRSILLWLYIFSLPRLQEVKGKVWKLAPHTCFSL